MWSEISSERGRHSGTKPLKGEKYGQNQPKFSRCHLHCGLSYNRLAVWVDIHINSITFRGVWSEFSSESGRHSGTKQPSKVRNLHKPDDFKIGIQSITESWKVSIFIFQQGKGNQLRALSRNKAILKGENSGQSELKLFTCRLHCEFAYNRLTVWDCHLYAHQFVRQNSVAFLTHSTILNW